jgi:hypothetical protein
MLDGNTVPTVQHVVSTLSTAQSTTRRLLEWCDEGGVADVRLVAKQALSWHQRRRALAVDTRIMTYTNMWTTVPDHVAAVVADTLDLTHGTEA